MNAEPTARFAFDPQRHEYTIDGVRVPSVTEILKVVVDFSGIPDAVLENARDRGEKLARAIDLHNRECLDRSSLDAGTLAGVDAWAQYLEDTGATVIESEAPVYHVGLRYAGKPDCVLAVGAHYVIPDVKATHEPPRTVGAQTAAYERAWAERVRRGKIQRECVHIKDGKYQRLPRRDPADWSLFVSCLNVYTFMRKNR